MCCVGFWLNLIGGSGNGVAGCGCGCCSSLVLSHRPRCWSTSCVVRRPHVNQSSILTCIITLRTAAPPLSTVLLQCRSTGGGTIGLELATASSLVFALNGDRCPSEMARYARNAAHASAGAGAGALRSDGVRWGAEALPLRAGMVDAVVSDLPWGKGVGSRDANEVLCESAGHLSLLLGRCHAARSCPSDCFVLAVYSARHVAQTQRCCVRRRECSGRDMVWRCY